MTGAPEVSIIIPYFNHGRYLHAAVQSALAATTRDVEVLIVNDGSVERGATTFLRNICLLSAKVRVIHKENGGLSSARNDGLAAASGRFVQFLDSDDALYPGKIDLQIQHLEARRDLVGSVCHYTTSDSWMTKLEADYDSIGRFPLTPDNFLFLWERGFSVPIHTGLFRSEVFQVLKFDTEVAGKEDWIFWTTLLHNWRDGLGYLPVLGAVYRLHDEGMTRSYQRMGESFLKAADTIAQLWNDEYPGFRSASRQWHDAYYVVMAERERLGSPIAAVPPPRLKTAKHRIATLDSVSTTPKRRRSQDDDSARRIDIVIPVFNHFDHLDACLSSALKQSGVGRVIVIDDASTDDRVEPMLRALAAREPRLTHLRNQTNEGISASQNTGVEAATAEFIGFLDCDDYLSPNAGEVLLAHMSRHPADYYFTDRADIDDENSLIRISRYGGYQWLKPSGRIERDLLLGMVASHWKVIRRSLYAELGGSNASLSGIQDWALALEACGRARFSYLAEPLYFHRIHDSATTSVHRMAQMWMTNVARRKQIVRLRPSAGPSLTVDAIQTHAELADRLEQIVNKGARLTFDDRGRDLSVGEIDILREFNSLFETLAVGENASVSLTGYLWDHNALASPPERAALNGRQE